MELLTPSVVNDIKVRILDNISSNNMDEIKDGIADVLDSLYANIPDNRRISYGHVHTIKVLAKYLWNEIPDNHFEFAISLFDLERDDRVAGVGLGLFSYYGQNNFNAVLPWFEKGASSEHWEIREHTQMFFRKLIKKYPEKAQSFLLKMVKSQDANVRRFVSETMRPVCENRWFYEQPEYSLKVMRNLFQEKDAYPRTSVGNNLSDLARKLPDMVFEIVEDLAASGDKNSYWIATRACRNLVKQWPDRVFNVLQTDEYRYKKKVYHRAGL